MRRGRVVRGGTLQKWPNPSLGYCPARLRPAPTALAPHADTTMTEILPALEAHPDALVDLADAVREGSEADRLAAVVGLLGKVLSDLPAVGALLDRAVQEVFARSAYGRVQAALAALADQQDQAARAQVTAQAVAQVLAPSLALVVGHMEDVRQNVQALQTLEARWQQERARVAIHQHRVEAGVGVDIGHDLDQDVNIEQGTIAGGTGVKLG